MTSASPQVPGKRPVIKIPYSPLDVIFEILTVIGIVSVLLLLITKWKYIPNTVPTHFSASGIVDSWGNKWSLMTLPCVGILFYVLLTIVSKFPHIFNYPWPITEDNVQSQYRIGRLMIISLKAEMVWLFTYLEWQSIQVSIGKAQGLGIAFLPIMFLVIFGTMGVLIYKAYKAR